MNLEEVLQYCHPAVFLNQEIEIDTPWGLETNTDCGSIREFALLAQLAFSQRWEIKLKAAV